MKTARKYAVFMLIFISKLSADGRKDIINSAVRNLPGINLFLISSLAAPYSLLLYLNLSLVSRNKIFMIMNYVQFYTLKIKRLIIILRHDYLSSKSFFSYCHECSTACPCSHHMHNVCWNSDSSTLQCVPGWRRVYFLSAKKTIIFY
jgi:hypothetical protein